MTVKIFKLREDGERMQSYKAISSVKEIKQTLTGLVFTLSRGFQDVTYEFEFNGHEYEMEVYF